MSHTFDIPFAALPARLPVFPLSGALLLPRCRLPLNVFEPRYLKMTEDALAGERLVGMVQPVDTNSDARAPQLYDVGCAGRITSFSETDDGRMLIILTGVSRFRVAEELPVESPYRVVVPDWRSHRHDLMPEPDGVIDRERLYASLRVYFEARSLDTDWEVLSEAGDESLINSLSMSCPFAATEKQALLEADDLGDRAELMLSLLDMAALDPADGELPLH
jgi:Lon protease-like protein